MSAYWLGRGASDLDPVSNRGARRACRDRRAVDGRDGDRVAEHAEGERESDHASS